MAHEQNSRTERYIRYALIILALALVVLLMFLVLQYQSLRQMQVVNGRTLRWSLFLNNHAPLPASDASVIRPWMTFDYVDKLFALPPDYLKTQLSITDIHYPRLTISTYTKNAHLEAATVLGQVISAVQKYSSPATSTSVSASATLRI